MTQHLRRAGRLALIAVPLGLIWYGTAQFHPGLGPAAVGLIIWIDFNRKKK